MRKICLGALLISSFVACKKKGGGDFPENTWRVGDSVYTVSSIVRNKDAGTITVEGTHSGKEGVLYLNFKKLPGHNSKIRVGAANSSDSVLAVFFASNKPIQYYESMFSAVEADVNFDQNKISIRVPDVWLYRYQYPTDSGTIAVVQDSICFSCNLEEQDNAPSR